MSALKALESVIDAFAREGGLVPNECKKTHPNQFNSEPDTFYNWDTEIGAHFKAALYQWKDGDGLVPYLAVVLNLGSLESATDQYELLTSMSSQTAEIYDPIKVVLENGLVSISLRTRADKIAVDYVRDLLPFMTHFAQRYLEFAGMKYGLVPMIQPVDEKRRVVQ